MIVDLSLSMQQRVDEWRRTGHKLDLQLLFNCSYYPRGGCQDCSFDAPNPKCKWAHLLIDTRINPPKFSFKQKSKQTINLETLIHKLPEKVQQQIRDILEGR